MTITQLHGRSLPSRLGRWAQTALVVGAAWLTACGGGGGGGADSGGNAITLSADVYPLADGDRRTWRVTNSLMVGALNSSERVADGWVVDGRSVMSVSSDWRGQEYLQRSSAGVTTVPGLYADPLIRAAGPIELLRFGQVAGTTVELFNRTLAVDLDGDGRTDSVDLRIECTFTGYEAVTTAAGTFTGAARVLSVAHVTVRGGGGQTAVITTTAEEWFAPGVGPVRSVTTTTQEGLGLPPFIETEELIAYGVGGRHSESVAPALMSASPGLDSVWRTAPTVELTFSEPLHPLTLDGPDGLILVDATGKLVDTTHTASENGTRITLIPQAALPDGRYEIRMGRALTDLANNPLPPAVRAFTVDTQGPRITTSTPAQGSEDAAATGAVLLRFNEPVFTRDGSSQVVVFVQDYQGTQYLPGVIQGADVVATLATPLQRNREYTLGVFSPLADAAGNSAPYNGTAVTIRTDPGPLARPTALMDNVEVSAVATGDINGDGRSDIVFAGHRIGEPDDYFIAARLQQADGRYAAPVRIHHLPPFQLCLSRSIVLADVNGDGRQDLAVAGCSSRLTMLVQQAGGGFVAELPPVDVTASRYGSLDLDGDGRAEIVAIQDRHFHFLRRDATGAWSVALTVDGGRPYIANFRVVDLNGDGQRDLVWLRAAPDNANSELAWALRQGNGFGAVRSQAINAAVISAAALAVSDVTGDGRPDVLLLMHLANDSQLAVLAQTVTGGFAAPVVHATYFSASTVETADVDGDGLQDVLVTHGTAHRLGVYLQASGGTLQSERLFETSYANLEYTDPVVVADLNADGRVDVVVGVDVLMGRPVAGAWPDSVPAHSRPATLADAAPSMRNCAPTVQPALREPVQRGVARWLHLAAPKQRAADAIAEPQGRAATARRAGSACAT